MKKTIRYLENGEYHYATVKDVGDIAKLKTDSKDDLVAAINELYLTGGIAKPVGYDDLVKKVTDNIEKQQDIDKKVDDVKRDSEANKAEVEQLVEEQKRKAEELRQSILRLNELAEKASQDAKRLEDNASSLQDDIDKKFNSVSESVKQTNAQLDNSSKQLQKELSDTKQDLENTKSRLQNNESGLDANRQQIQRAEIELEKTKTELQSKASTESLDTVTQSVEKLDAQVKQNAKGIEVAVKRDELSGNVASLLHDKTNLLLGTRSFSGEDNWKNRDTVTIEPGYYKGLKSAAVQVLDGSIYQPYRVKADTSYTFSFFAREDKDNPKAKLAIKPIDAKNINIDNEEQVVHITTEWQRFAVTFSVDKECDISIQIIQGPETTNNVLHLAGLKLQYGQNDTPWEPNEADVAENIEKNESRFNVFSDQITGIVKKQEKMGDTERQLDTRITETAEGLKQTSKDLQNANGKITEFKGQLESTAKGIKTEYEKYTNEAIGQISDSSLNLIRNSAFSNRNSDFDQWQNVSAKVNIREDNNQLRWAEITQSGLTSDNPVGLTSNYFSVKQGKVTVAVDIKSGEKATLDNPSVLFIELYDQNKKRVDFQWVNLNDLGLSTEILSDHLVHRGMYRKAIDRADAKYMTVKAHVMRNGDLWLTNFSARLSSIDDGGYTPNPDDVNHQILKMNTKIEEDAEHIALKANSVDVTRDIKSAVDGIDISGVNLLRNTDPKQIDEVESDSTWILGSFGNGSAKVIDLPNSNIFTAKHGFEIYGNTNGNRDFTQRPIHWTNNKYVFSVYARIADVSSAKSVDMMTRAWSNQTNRAVFENHYTLTSKQWTRVTMSIDASSFYDQTGVSLAFGLSGYGSIDFAQPMLELANKASKWSPNPQDTSAEIKSAKDAAIQVASDQINLHVNELSTQFDDKLNKRVNEVKTAGEKFTSDGIEQTVSKITDVKNQVDGVKSKVDNLKVGGRNLVRNTDTDIVINDTGNTGTQGWCFATINLTQQPKVGDQLTVSAEGTLTGKGNLSAYEAVLYDKITTTPRSNVVDLVPGKRSSAILTVSNLNGKGDTVLLIYSGKITDTEGKKNTVHHLKVEFGNVATDWTPAPEDINQKIDTQTLDSANIDNMRTQGHYFIHNLDGNPTSGWVYVDVSGNGLDRIRQDVYQDSNSTVHFHRKLFGNSWTPWEKEATQTDINNLRTETTASVKNLGDRVTTEVNSITSRVNSNNGGGVNLLLNTQSFDQNWIWDSIGHSFANGILTLSDTNNGNSRMYQAIAGKSPAGRTFTLSFNARISDDCNSEKVGVRVGPYDAGKSIDVTGKSFQSYKLEGWQWTGTSITFSFYVIGGKIDISNLKLEYGYVATPWSQAPEDVNEAIKSVNTKLDVANGKIEGKVTATDVNNILNGKGYATQSWAQTMFTMKSDAITLQAVRDNITNGIQNQVNDTRNILNNLQVGGRNILSNTENLVYKAKVTNSTNNPNSGDSMWKLAVGNLSDWLRNNPDVKEIAISYDYELQGATPTGTIRFGVNQAPTWEYMSGFNLQGKPAKGRVKLIVPVTDNMRETASNISRIRGDGLPIGATLIISHPKWEVGNKATDWSPAPQDSKSYTDQQITNTNKKIDTQTLDSANIDQMKTQGHYFVKNLTGNPIPGWVYVDVTGNNNDRIRQDVYADQSYVHKFRSWNGWRWTDWEEEVKNTDIISKINMSPEKIKLASNKIEIDGNTYIHGELNVPTVKLNGRNGSIDLSGDGIHIEGPDGDIKLDSGGIDITKNGQGLSISGDYIQVVTDSNGQKEITGLIGSNFNLKNKNQNGLALLVTPQQDLGRPYGGDILTIGALQKNGEVMSAVTFDATNITGNGSGFHWTAPHYLHGPAQAIHIENAQDNLTLLPLKMPHSSQENYYQPALTVTHGIDGNGNYVHGDSGVEFLWNSIKPYGSVDMTDARLWVYGVDHGIKNVWVSWSNWDGGERYPALVNDIGYWGGIAFPKSGRVTLFDADGRYYAPDRNTGIGAYDNYMGKNNWH